MPLVSVMRAAVLLLALFCSYAAFTPAHGQVLTICRLQTEAFSLNRIDGRHKTGPLIDASVLSVIATVEKVAAYGPQAADYYLERPEHISHVVTIRVRRTLAGHAPQDGLIRVGLTFPGSLRYQWRSLDAVASSREDYIAIRAEQIGQGQFTPLHGWVQHSGAFAEMPEYNPDDPEASVPVCLREYLVEPGKTYLFSFNAEYYLSFVEPIPGGDPVFARTVLSR
ncbi:MAG: hypothetical protein ACXIVL_08715 [Oceanicaulis sp.]